jgi:RNA polymerase sigma-54 factor
VVKPSLQIRLSQHLALTPQLQQSIRLLQLSTLELHQEVEQMLEQNPFLEADDDGPAFEPLADRPAPDARDEDAQRDTHEVSDEPDGTDLAGFATTDSVDWEDSANGDDFDGIAEAPSGSGGGSSSADGEDAGVYERRGAAPTLEDHLRQQLL